MKSGDTSKNIIWKPQKKQEQFLMRFEDEALYGGAAGGGKSDALLVEALRQIHVPHYRAIIFRKTMPQCSELIDRSREIYGYFGGKFNVSRAVWTFPTGAKIYFGSMRSKAERIKYQGKRYDFIGFDELTHFLWDEYSYMFSRNRSGGKGTRCYIRATCNPGGVGHGWVKERFISGKEPFKTYYENVNINGKVYTKSRIFIPSSVFDNAILMENNPDYVASLGILPENEKKALLYGDWDSFSGQVFCEFRNNPEGYLTRKFSHVIYPFEIPFSWKRYRSFDFGYSKPFSVGWWAISEDGVAYRYRELYGSTGDPDVGIKYTPTQIAKQIRKIEIKYEPNSKIIGIADPAIWDMSRGMEGSIISVMEREGIFFDKAKNSRIAGKMQFHYRLSFDEEGYSRCYVFNTCTDFIRTVPALTYDTMDVEDVNTHGEDHIYDESRYFFMAHPVSPILVNKSIENLLGENPLEL